MSQGGQRTAWVTVRHAGANVAGGTVNACRNTQGTAREECPLLIQAVQGSQDRSGRWVRVREWHVGEETLCGSLRVKL
jgi:hypothetical protein